MKRPTIIDVARTAGVSKSTVSLVLNDSPLVTQAKRDRVREAMDALGYVYNRAAAKLRSDRVGLIGLVVNDLRVPFFTEFAVSAQEALAARGYATVIANSNEDTAVQRMVLTSMIEHGVSALMISAAPGDPGLADLILRSGLPTLTVLRQMEGDGGFPCVTFDFTDGSRQALDHLIERGARRIAFIGSDSWRPVYTARVAGFGGRMGPGEPVVMAMEGPITRSFGRESAARLLEAGIDGAMCFNDFIALGLIDGLHEAGRRAGRDMAVIGFEDIPEAARATPSLSSIDLGIPALGRHAARMVLDWMERDVRPPDRYLQAPTLRVRESTGQP